MHGPPLYPLRFAPVYKNYVWGGRRIPERYLRRDAPAGKVAESWEISDHEAGLSVVDAGPAAGQSLRACSRRTPARSWGAASPDRDFLC